MEHVRNPLRGYYRELIETKALSGPNPAGDLGFFVGAFGLDVLACPRCGGRLRLIATIADPPVVEQILAPLGLAPAPRPPGPAPPAGTAVIAHPQRAASGASLALCPTSAVLDARPLLDQNHQADDPARDGFPGPARSVPGAEGSRRPPDLGR